MHVNSGSILNFLPNNSWRFFSMRKKGNRSVIASLSSCNEKFASIVFRICFFSSKEPFLNFSFAFCPNTKTSSNFFLRSMSFAFYFLSFSETISSSFWTSSLSFLNNSSDSMPFASFRPKTDNSCSRLLYSFSNSVIRRLLLIKSLFSDCITVWITYWIVSWGNSNFSSVAKIWLSRSARFNWHCGQALFFFLVQRRWRALKI